MRGQACKQCWPGIRLKDQRLGPLTLYSGSDVGELCRRDTVTGSATAGATRDKPAEGYVKKACWNHSTRGVETLFSDTQTTSKRTRKWEKSLRRCRNCAAARISRCCLRPSTLA